MSPLDWEWWFHWTHDEICKEVLKALIPALGYVFVGVITWIGIWRTSKIAKQTLEDTREATPPELLRLEKWSAIIKDSNDYPENIKYELDIDTIQSTYNDILKRATLENRAMNLGISDPEIRKALLYINPCSGDGTYPVQSWNVLINRKNILFIVIYLILVIFDFYILHIAYANFENPSLEPWQATISFCTGLGIFLLLFILETLGIYGLVWYEARIKSLKNNIVFRNGYYALKDIYLIEGHKEIYENAKEIKERDKFEETKEYIKWKTKMDEKGFELSSWNYGLSIDWDNDPEKIKFNELGDDNPVGSESESPKLIQKLFRVKLFSRGPHETNP